MARVKSLAAKKHRKIRKLTKGFMQARSRRLKAGREAVLHAGQYAYAGRKQKRRNIKKLWIIRLNSAARENDLTYKELINKLKTNKVELDRKILADLAVKQPQVFSSIIKELK